MAKSKNRSDYEPNDVIFTNPILFELLNVEFDVDVCCPKVKPDWIPAKKHYWLELDGLKQDWVGNVWCNPPYSNSKPWIEKFVSHKFGIILVPFSKSKAFNLLWNSVEAILPLPANYKFIDVNNKFKSIYQPVGLFAYGDINVKALQNVGGLIR